MRGFSSWKRSQVKPWRSSTPGPKFSTMTSQRRTSASITVLPLGRLHVDRDAALVRVQHREIEAVGALHVLQLAAGDVAAAGQLDLDHVGAHPGQQLRPGRAGLDMAHIEDAHAFECFAHSPLPALLIRHSRESRDSVPHGRRAARWIPALRGVTTSHRASCRENRRAARHARRAPACARAPAARRLRGRGVRAPR